MTICIIAEQYPDRNAPPNVAFATLVTTSFEQFAVGRELLAHLFRTGPIQIYLDEHAPIPEDIRNIRARWDDATRTLDVSCLRALDNEGVLREVLTDIYDGLSVVACADLNPEHLPHILSYPNSREFILDMSRREYKAYLIKLALRSLPLIAYENYVTTVFSVGGNNVASLQEHYDILYRNKITTLQNAIKKSAEFIGGQNFDFTQFENTKVKGPVDLRLCDALLRADKIKDEAQTLHATGVEILTVGSAETKLFFNASELVAYSEQVKALADQTIARLNALQKTAVVPVLPAQPPAFRPPAAADTSAIAAVEKVDVYNPYLFYPPSDSLTANHEPTPAAADLSAILAVEGGDVYNLQ